MTVQKPTEQKHPLVNADYMHLKQINAAFAKIL